MQLEDAFEGYWLSKKRSLSVNTVNDYQLTFRRFGEFLRGRKTLEQITAKDVERFLNHLADDLRLSQKSVLNCWIALSSFWTWAERTLEVPHVMRGKVDRPRPRRRQSSPFEEVEVRAMVAACGEAAGWRSKNGAKVSS